MPRLAYRIKQIFVRSRNAYRCFPYNPEICGREASPRILQIFVRDFSTRFQKVIGTNSDNSECIHRLWVRLPHSDTNLVKSMAPSNEKDSSTTPSQDLDPGVWLAKYGDSLYRFALARVRSDALAEDLVQETLVAGWKSRDKFSGKSSVSTWLFSILRNKLIDHFRRSKREATLLVRHDEELPEQLESTATQWPQSPGAEVEAEEFWEVFHSCVAKLPSKLAEAYTLRELNDKSPKEICELLQISPTNLSMRLQRARFALRDCLQLNWFC